MERMKRERTIAPGQISNRKNIKAFTLIELLVTIAIISILAAILFPVFARAREQARKAACQSNLKQIGLGVMMYVQDYDERYPMAEMYKVSGTTTYFYNVLQPYIKSARGNGVWICPTAGVIKNSSGYPLYSGGYGWNSLGDTKEPAAKGHGFGYRVSNPTTPTGTIGVPLSAVTEPAETILIGDPASNAYGGNGLDLYPGYWQGQIPVLHGGQVGPFYEEGKSRISMTNYEGGGNYLFADGHVKTLQNTYVWSNRVALFRVDK